MDPDATASSSRRRHTFARRFLSLVNESRGRDARHRRDDDDVHDADAHHQDLDADDATETRADARDDDDDARGENGVANDAEERCRHGSRHARCPRSRA